MKRVEDLANQIEALPEDAAIPEIFQQAAETLKDPVEINELIAILRTRGPNQGTLLADIALSTDLRVLTLNSFDDTSLIAVTRALELGDPATLLFTAQTIARMYPRLGTDALRVQLPAEAVYLAKADELAANAQDTAAAALRAVILARKMAVDEFGAANGGQDG